MTESLNTNERMVRALIKYKFDKRNSFVSVFDSDTGFYIRSGILDHGKDTGIDPFMASFPELIDIGIMGHCNHGLSGLCLESGVQCSQDGLHSQKSHMRLEDFRRIVSECRGRTFQIALGGCGDPDQHPYFMDILRICRENNIVPNFTSSGFGFTDQIVNLCSEYCGAVAISWYRSQYTYRAIDMLLNAGVKTNIHYVLGKNSLSEAIIRLKENGFPRGINSVIFLLHKPVGLGMRENILTEETKDITTFFDLIDRKNFPFKIGFDSCSIPGLIQHCSNIALSSVDTCEGGRWSMYISADMKAYPCSFDNQEQRWACDISDKTIDEAWNSAVFEDFRDHLRNACPACSKRIICMGGCPICKEIVMCAQK